MMNSVRGRPKRSRLEKDTGRFVLDVFIILVLICLLSGLIYAIWEENNSNIVESYIKDEHRSFIYNFFVRAGNWLLILGNFVPISMLVTLELAKLAEAKLMSIDYGMVSSNGIECKINTSSLNEELGQIDYVFSDKTGTLTRNEMRFKNLIIGDKIYGENTGYTGQMPEVKNVEFSDPKAWELIEQSGQNEESYDFMETVRFLALCHTIIVEKNGDYSASSPDELAFVNFAKLLGYEFVGIDDDNNMTLMD